LTAEHRKGQGRRAGKKEENKKKRASVRSRESSRLSVGRWLALSGMA